MKKRIIAWAVLLSVCAAAGLYGLYNAISCFVTLYKAGHQPYLMAGAVRFDFQGYYI